MLLSPPPPPLEQALAPPLVAVLDTGVDSAAPGLGQGAIAAGARSFLPGGTAATVDPQGHGTQVAQVVAQWAGGPGAVRILPVAVADREGSAGTSALVRGIRYAVARGARVINVSFGGRGFSAIEQRAIDDAVRRGALVVVAAGNSGAAGPREYPGAYRQVLAVGALGESGRPLGISVSGPQIALAAPGVDTRPGPHGATVTRIGTSMAAAAVSGTAARVLARRPRLTPHQLAALLVATARDVPPPGRDDATGAGVVDPATALRARPPLPGDAEPNDDPALARRLPALLPGAGARRATVRGRTGSWSDPRDGFRVMLRAGDEIVVRLRGPAAADLDLALWRPGATGGPRGPRFARRWLAAASLGPRSTEEIRHTAQLDGMHTVEVQGSRGLAQYHLRVERIPGTRA